VNLRRLSPHQLGRLGEQIAATHLQRHRMQILARNWRHRLGELDLIARSADTVVFCEVKTRRSRRYGGPLGAVDGEKLQRIERLARAWLQEYCRTDQPWRIDRLALTVTGGRRLELEHHQGNRHGLRAHEHRLHDRLDRRRGDRRGLRVQVLRERHRHGPHVGAAGQRRQPGADPGPLGDGELRVALSG
jgi:putative endonuclease